MNMIEHLLNELTIVSTQLKFQSFFNEVRFGLFLVAATRGFTMGNTGCFRKAHEDNSKQNAKKTTRYLSGLEDVSNKINLGTPKINL